MPCGVEIPICSCFSYRLLPDVPNVPCGVEMLTSLMGMAINQAFLMCRVELKCWVYLCNLIALNYVPNVPCGVEILTTKSKILQEV